MTSPAPTAATGLNVFVVGNDFDPDGDGFSVVKVAHPAHGTVGSRRQLASTTHPTPASPASRPSPTHPRQPRPHCHRARRRVGRHRGAGSARHRSPAPTTCTSTKAPRCRFTDRRAAVQRRRPTRPDPHGRRGVGTRHQRHPHRRPRHRVHLHPQQRPEPHRHRPPTQLPRHRHRRPRRPKPTSSIRILAAGDPNQAPVARDDVARTDAAHRSNVFVVGNDFDPDGDSFIVVKVTHPAHGTVGVFSNWLRLHTQPRLLRRRDHHLHPPRHPRPHRHRTSTVWVDTGVTGDQITGRRHRLLVRVPRRRRWPLTTAELLSNDVDPQGQTPHGRGGVRARHRRHPHR